MVRNDASVIENVQNFAKEIKKQDIHLRKIILFGSHAHGKAHAYSDVDIAIVADEFVSVSFEDIKYFIDVTIQKSYFSFEYHTFSTADFEEGNPFIDEIQRTGIVIFD
jgi:uncharacterized protein